MYRQRSGGRGNDRGIRVFHEVSGRGELIPQAKFILLVWIPCWMVKFSDPTSLIVLFLSDPSITIISDKAPWKGAVEWMGRIGWECLFGKDELGRIGWDVLVGNVCLGRMGWKGLVGKDWSRAGFWERLLGKDGLGWIGRKRKEKCDENKIKWSWEHDGKALKSN